VNFIILIRLPKKLIPTVLALQHAPLLQGQCPFVLSRVAAHEAGARRPCLRQPADVPGIVSKHTAVILFDALFDALLVMASDGA
jgi:hypothetical protein